MPFVCSCYIPNQILELFPKGYRETKENLELECAHYAGPSPPEGKMKGAAELAASCLIGYQRPLYKDTFAGLEPHLKGASYHSFI